MEANDARFYELLTELRSVKSDTQELRADMKTVQSDMKTVQSGMKTVQSGMKTMQTTLKEVTTTTERMALSLEEEAQQVAMYLLENNYKIQVELTTFQENGLELDVYGVSGELCVLGEVGVRLGSAKLNDLVTKVHYIRKTHPQLLQNQLILLLYGMRFTPQLLELAEEQKIWVITATKELTSFQIQDHT